MSLLWFIRLLRFRLTGLKQHQNLCALFVLAVHRIRAPVAGGLRGPWPVPVCAAATHGQGSGGLGSDARRP